MLRKLSILLMIFSVFYMAAHYWVRWKNRVGEDSVKSTRLIDCEPDQIRQIKLSRIDEAGALQTFSFVRADSPEEGVPASARMTFADWRIVEGGAGEADSSLVSGIVASICEIYDPIPARESDAAASDLKSKKSQSLQFEVQGRGNIAAKAHVIRFLDFTRDRLSLIDADGALYKVSPKLQQILSSDPKSFQNYRVVRMAPDMIQAASVMVDGKERFTLERDGSDWRVMLGGKLVGRGSDEAGRFVNRISTLRALDITNTAFSAADCDAEKGKIRIELSGLTNKKETIYFGSDAKIKTKLFSCSTARLSRFLVHVDMLKYLNASMKALTALH